VSKSLLGFAGFIRSSLLKVGLSVLIQ
jgi:hypothetical protein